MKNGYRALAAATLYVSTPAFAAESPAVSTAGSLLQVFIGLVAVLLLIAVTAWVAKRLGVTRGGSSNLLHVVSSVAVGGASVLSSSKSANPGWWWSCPQAVSMR